MIVDRKTFIAIMVHEGGVEEEYLFMPETDTYLNREGKPPANWFMNCPIIQQMYRNQGDDYSSKKRYFWDWCEQHLQGAIYVYSESDTEQWWGFANKDDIFLWSLKWL